MKQLNKWLQNETKLFAGLVRWLLIVAFLVSVISFVIVYQENYIAQEHIASALPLSIVTGLTAIALAIMGKK